MTIDVAPGLDGRYYVTAPLKSGLAHDSFATKEEALAFAQSFYGGQVIEITAAEQAKLNELATSMNITPDQAIEVYVFAKANPLENFMPPVDEAEELAERMYSTGTWSSFEKAHAQAKFYARQAANSNRTLEQYLQAWGLDKHIPAKVSA